MSDIGIRTELRAGSCGFEPTQQQTTERWGAVLTEERYDVWLAQ